MAAPPSGPRPLLRTGGIALLGVGILAAAIGVFTAATGGNGAGTAVPSASSQALPPSAPASGAAVVPAEPIPSAAAPAPTAAVGATPAETAPAVPDGAAARSTPPLAAGPAPDAASGGERGAARAPLRVYNNSLIQGLAAQAKADFEAAGWAVTEISGYSGGTVPASTAYFRPGTSEEAAAQELGREFGLRVEPRFPGIAQSTGGVIVIVTADYKPGGKS